MKVKDYLAYKGIDAEGLALLLTEKMGRKLGAGAVIAREDKDLPKVWVEALGDVPPDIIEEAEETGAKEKATRRQERTPKPVQEFNPLLAEERVAAIYDLIGKGVSAATKEPRYSETFTAHAEKCGKAWTELAKHDKHVATVLTMLTTGGPWGEVVWLHMSLGFALVVISGKAPIGILGSTIPAAPAAPEQHATENGGSGAGAPDSVGEAPG